jgi:hypothetical protein
MLRQGPAAVLGYDRAALLWTILLAGSHGGLAGCQGDIGVGGGHTSGSGNGGAGVTAGLPLGAGAAGSGAIAECKGSSVPSVPAVPLQRLTQQQYLNSVRDLLGVPNVASLGLGLPADEKLGTFRSNTIAPLGDLGASQYQSAAQQLATLALSQVPTILPCATAQLNAACVSQLTTQFGRRAYRRPLTASEQSAYATLVAASNGAGDFKTSARLVIEAMLQSPNFLYRVELPPAGAVAGTPTRLASHELATRLAFFLWDSTPDETLLAAADTNQLAGQTLTTQAQRLIGDDRFKDGIASFFSQWLDVDTMPSMTKDATLFPSFTPELGAAMQSEPLNFATYVLKQGDGKLSTLLTAPYSILSAPLFSLYGIKQPANYDAGTAATTPVTLTATQRAGILTQPGFLAVHAHPDQTSPVLLGKAIRQNFLCQTLPDPPPNVNTSLPATSPGQTTRQRFAQHELDPVCGACHQLMDPVGLGFSNYDAIGVFQATEGGQPIDASGNLLQAGDATTTFNGVVDLATKLARSQTVQQCASLQWMRFALGRQEAPEDTCSIATVNAEFNKSGQDINALLVSIVSSDAFQWRAN